MTSGTIDGHTDVFPELMTKRQLAELLQCSQRQIEILTKKKRLPQAIYLGSSSPRWSRTAVLATLMNEPAK